MKQLHNLQKWGVLVIVIFSALIIGQPVKVFSLDFDDMDGVPADEEVLVENAIGSGQGDGNGDGIQDYTQNKVTSFRDITGRNVLTLESIENGGEGYEGTFWQENVQAVATPTDAPTDITFPYGMLEFKISNLMDDRPVVFRLFVPKNTSITGYWKKNVETGKWENIATQVLHGPEWAPNKTVIIFSLTDGGEYDEDRMINGEILDQGGPGIGGAAPVAISVPVMNQTGMIIFGLLITASVILIHRKRPSLVKS